MDITGIADRITEYTRLLAQGQISDLERDILLADLRDLYSLVKGHAISVSVTSTPAPIAETKKAETPTIIPQVEVTPPVAEPVITQPVIIPIIEETKEVPPVIKQEPEPVIIASIKEEPLLIEKQEDPIQKVTNRIHYDEGAPVRGPKVNSLNEVFVGEERSINSRLGGGEKKQALNDTIHSKDLKGLIDFNKQHVLINELFAGDSVAFHSAISHINSSPTIEAAFEYIKSDLLPRYKWNGELQSTRLFDKLVRQKFGV